MTPSKLRLHRKSALLEVVFGEHTYQLPAEYLRVFSPSAEVSGHGPGQEVLQLNKQSVQINNIEAQGNYAVKLIFSDGHDSGIYTWDYLRQLGENQNKLWANYLTKVARYHEQQAQAQTRAVTWVDPSQH